jgi:hypothetical protein
VLRHEGIARPHVDFMVETAPGSLLSTWRLEAWPIVGERPAEKLPDHRRDYLTYEGPLSGNRGHVRQIESGECDLSIEGGQSLASPPVWRLALRGSAAVGRMTLAFNESQWTASRLDPP